jgi:hypothetical protein
LVPDRYDWGILLLKTSSKTSKKMSESEQFIQDYPTLGFNEARKVLEMHGFDDADYGDRGDLGVSFDPEGYEHICDISPEGEIDTQEIFDWLGY